MSPEMNFQMTERLTFMLFALEAFFFWLGYSAGDRMLMMWSLMTLASGFVWRALYNEGWYQYLVQSDRVELVGIVTVTFYCIYLACAVISFLAAGALV